MTKMLYPTFISLTIALFLALAACSPQTTPTSSPTATPQDPLVPTETGGPVEPPYPASTDTPPPPIDAPYPATRPTQPAPYIDAPYPVETATTPSSDIVPFNLDKPIAAGSTQVTGTGPAGVPIIILDVTFMGNPLGQTTIKTDGTFQVDVPALQRGIRIGIALADLSGTQWDPEDFQDPGYNGEDAQNVPLVGFFYDTAQVQ